MKPIDPDRAIAAAELAANPEPLDTYENALVQYLKRTPKPTLVGVLAIWGWRSAMEPSYIQFGYLAEALWELCERLDLMDHSINSCPGGPGGFGVLCDAEPGREWALCLDAGDLKDPLTDPNRLYWFRIVSVLCSRLRMAEVARLPGYDHDAKVGPFAGGAS